MIFFKGDSNKKKLIVFGLILFLVAGFLAWIIIKKNNMMSDLGSMNVADNGKIAYTIPGVPYYGLHNRFKEVDFEIVNSAASVMGYWNPEEDLNVSEMQSALSSASTVNVVNFFSKKGYLAKTEKLSLPDLKKYINPQTKTPLMLFLPVAIDQPVAVTYYPLVILFGIDENKQILTFHNYWLGNNYEISFAEFNQLESKLPAYQQNVYIVIQPKDLSEKLQEIAQRKIENYPARTSLMQNGDQLLKDYGIGFGAYALKLRDVSLNYFSKIEKSTQVDEYFSPYLKMGMFYKMSQIYYEKNNFDDALAYAQKAVAEDHDLDKPFKDWPGIKNSINTTGNQDKSSYPYVILGDIYRQKGDFQNAKGNYLKALDIYPDNLKAKDGLAILNAVGK